MQNQNYFPWEEINEKDELDTGMYHFRIREVEDTVSGNGNKMFKVKMTVLAPLDFANMFYTEVYSVGTPEMPNTIVPTSMGAKAFKKLIMACQVPRNNDPNVIIQSLIGAEFVGGVRYKPDADFKNNITSYFRVGERVPGLASVSGQTSGPAMAGQAAAMAPPMPSAPTMPGQSTAPPPPQSAPVAPTAPMAPPVQQPAAPVQQAPPVQAALAGPMLRCTICNQDVSAMAFGAHVARHQSEPGWNGIS